MGKIRETSVEKLFDGRLLCRQHRQGYRFSHDPILLAHFFTPRPEERIIDLGSGCGIIPLILGYRHPDVSATAFEMQAQLVELARTNIIANGLEDRVEVVEGDLCHIEDHFPAASFDRVVANPPYRPAGEGRVNPDKEQALARHELGLSLADVVRAADWLLVRGGRFDLIYPFARREELLSRLQEKDLAPVRLQAVHSYPGKKAGLVLVEAVKGVGGKKAEQPPFYVHRDSGGDYTDEMKRLYEP